MSKRFLILNFIVFYFLRTTKSGVALRRAIKAAMPQPRKKVSADKPKIAEAVQTLRDGMRAD